MFTYLSDKSHSAEADDAFKYLQRSAAKSVESHLEKNYNATLSLVVKY